MFRKEKEILSGNMCIDLYETDGLLLFSSKSIIFQTTDLERVIEKAENIFNFYLDFNWEFRFIGENISQSAEKKKAYTPGEVRKVGEDWVAPPIQKRPAGLRGVWSGKRDSNYILSCIGGQQRRLWLHGCASGGPPEQERIHAGCDCCKYGRSVGG